RVDRRIHAVVLDVAELDSLRRRVPACGAAGDVNLVSVAGILAMSGKPDIAVGSDGRVVDRVAVVERAVDAHGLAPMAVGLPFDMPEVGAGEMLPGHFGRHRRSSGRLETK